MSAKIKTIGPLIILVVIALVFFLYYTVEKKEFIEVKAYYYDKDGNLIGTSERSWWQKLAKYAGQEAVICTGGTCYNQSNPNIFWNEVAVEIPVATASIVLPITVNNVGAVDIQLSSSNNIMYYWK